ncbi:AMB1 [Auxenochlorella protothecoides x Auxenochlorella symbiontica]
MWDCRLGSNLAAGPSNRCSAAAWNLRPQVQRRQRDVGPCCSVASETVNRPGDTAPSPPAPATLRSTFAKPDSELQSLLRRVYAGRSCSVAAPSRDAAAAAPRRAPVPVYVMLPLDTVWLLERDGGAQPVLIREKAMAVGLEMLSAAGVSGVMVDVWWGIVEHAGPRRYDWSAYRRLFDAVAAKGLRIQAVMSFHAAGGNVGDTCTIPLPRWVVKAGEADPDIFYTDAHGARNRECLSLGCDEAPVLAGRTPVAAYRDFAAAFAAEFRDLLGSGITEITLGLGPAGELRYPPPTQRPRPPIRRPRPWTPARRRCCASALPPRWA